jgi:hypothetical protein
MASFTASQLITFLEGKPMIIRNLIAASLVALAPAAHAATAPVGPQTNVAAATVAGWGFTECFSATMSTVTSGTSSSGGFGTALAGCTGDLLMVAGRATGSATFLLLAAANKSDVLTETAGDATNMFNGSEWYYTPDSAFGYAGAGDAVSLGNCDTRSTNASLRFCQHLNPFGGYRIGNLEVLNFSTDYEKVYLSAVSAVPLPATALLFIAGIGALGAAGARRSKA